MENYPAIYQIKFSGIDRIYIGSTLNFCRRKSQHLWNLRRNIHSNKKLQNYYNKYGESSIKIFPVECFLDKDVNYIFKVEQEYLDKYFAQEYILSDFKDKRFDKLTLNIVPKVGSSCQYWTDERREQQRKRNRDFVWTDEIKLKMSNTKKGKIPTLEARLAVSKSLNLFYSKTREERNIHCKHCDSINTKKGGKRFNKTKNVFSQSYLCNICKRKFQVY